MFNWYKIFNLTEFEALELVSRTYTLDLEGLGLKDILVTKGNRIALTYEGVMLSLELNDRNPYEFEGLAVYIDDETQDVYLGIEVEDDED